MATLYITPSAKPSPEEKAHNRALLEKYMPDLIEFFKDARAHLGVKFTGSMKIQIPDEDLEFVQSNMDATKKLVR